jgi:hypothetical protein
MSTNKPTKRPGKHPLVKPVKLDDAAILVRPHDRLEWDTVIALSFVRNVRPKDDGLADIVWASMTDGEPKVRTGETDLQGVLTALGW